MLKRDLEKLDRTVVHAMIHLGFDYGYGDGEREVKVTILDGILAEEDVEFITDVCVDLEKEDDERRE